MKRHKKSLRLHILPFALLAIMLITIHTRPAMAAVSPGDIAVIGYNALPASTTKTFAVVTLASIASGEVIFFTDKGISGGGFQGDLGTEGIFSLTTTTTIAAGTVIQFSVTSGSVLPAPNVTSSPSVGTLTVTNGWSSTSTASPFGLNGDQILIFQGSTASPTFVFGFNASTNTSTLVNGWYTGTSTANNYSEIPPGLTNGTNAVSHSTSGPGAFDNYVYTGTFSGTKAAVLAAICNAANWSGNDTTPYDNAPGGTQFPGTNPIFTIGGSTPTVNSVSVPSNGTYVAGQNLDFTINFSESITVNTAGGTPQLSLTIGAATRQAVYTSGSGTSALLFRYTVQTGDLDANGVTVGTLAANGGTLQNASASNANLTLNNVGSTTAVLVDAVAPTVSSVSVPSNGTYITGQNLDFTINFSENVTVNTAGGTPQLSLTIGVTTRQAVYTSGSGTSALLFRYTVQTGELDTDGITVGTLAANGGTLRDAATNNANLTLNSVGSTASVLVDALAPAVSSVTVPSNSTYITGQNLDFTINFNENVNVNTAGGTPQLSLTIGSTSRQAVYTSGSGTSALLFRYTVQTGELDTDGITVGTLAANGGTLRDAATNNANLTLNGVGSTTSVLVDAVAPTVSSVNVPSNGTYITGQNLDFTINFTENITVNTAGGTPQLSLTIGATTRQAVYTSGTGTSALLFRYTVQSGDLDTDGITVGTLSANGGTLRDAATNNANLTLNSVGNTTSVLVDAVAPTVSSVSVPSNGSYNAGQNLDFTINFSENVTVNTAGGTPQMSLTIGATTRQALYTSGSGTSALLFRYTVQSGELDTDGITIGILAANGGTLRDAATNDANLTLNSIGSTTSVLVDAIAPTINSVTVPANNTYITSQNLDFTINFNENVTVNTAGGTPQLSLTIGATTRQAVYNSGTGTSAVVFRYTIQSGDLDADGIAVGSLAANGGTLRDAAANDANLTLNSVGSTTAVLVDAVAPTVSSVGVPSNGTYVAGQDLDFTINFTENITVNTAGGTPQMSLTIGAATRQAVYTSGAGTTALLFRYTVQSGELDTDGITVGTFAANGGTLTDPPGNNATLTLNSVGSTTAVLVDAVAPTVSSVAVPSNGTYIAGQDLDFTVNFTENITVNTAGGTPQMSVTIGATTRQAVYISGTGTSALLFRYTVQSGDLDTDGIAVGTLAANGGTLRDAAANNANLTLNGVGSTTAVLVDAVPPTVSSVTVPPNATYIAGQNLDFTINFSENVTVNTAGGTPQLSITIGATTRQAVYNSGSGTSAVVFRYTVQSGELDTDGIAVGTLAANGGTLRDAATNDANLTLNSVGSTTAVLVDAVAPTVSSVGVPSNGTYVAGQDLDFTINFTENITVNTAGGTPQLSITIGATTRQAVYTSGTGTSALVFRYTVQSGDLDTDGIAIGTLAANGGTLRDAATNNANLTLNSVGSTTSVLVDAVAPTVSSVSPLDDATNVALNTNLVINFNENIAVGTGSLLIRRISDNSTVQSISATDATQVSVSGNVLTINPSSDLPLGESVYINAATGFVTDIAGNPYLGIGDNITWNFTLLNQTGISVNDPAVAEGNSGSVTLTFTVSLSQPAPAGGATVDFATSDGTATAGSDYTLTSGTLTYAAGESTKTVNVTVSGDNTLEASETITLTLSNETGTNVVISDATGTGTITNDDAAAVTIANVGGAENGGGITVTATLDNPVQGGFTVQVSTADGTATTADNDYTAVTNQTLTFAGTAGETQTFTVTPTADTKLEADETLTVSQANLGATSLPVNITDGATITINNDDAAALTINDVSGNEDDGAITVTVTLDNAVQGGFTVDAGTSDGTAVAGSDYTAVSGQTLTFAGTAGESETFTITPTVDSNPELNETISVSLSNLAATTLPVNISDGAVVTIIDDDASQISVSDPTVAEGASGTVNLTFTVSLDITNPGTVTVDYATSDGTATAGSDYTAASGTLTFTTGETSKTFDVVVSGDNMLEADETLTVTLSNVTGSGAVISDATGTGTITNDDAAAVTIANVSGAEDGGGITVTATLDNPVQGGFTVQVSTADGTATTADNDYTAVTNQTLTFSGTAGETQTFTVTPTADTNLELDETLTVSQANLGATSLPVNITDGATVTINNDDAAALTINNVSGNEDDGAITVTVSLDNAVPGGFTVDVSTSNGTAIAGSDYTAVTGQTLTFTGTAGESQTFTVTPTADTDPEQNETINISLSNLAATALPVNITDGAVVTIIDDDAAQISLSDASVTEGSSGTVNLVFTVTLDQAGAATITVDYTTSDGTATAGSDYATASGTVTFAAGETSKTINVAVSGDDIVETDETLTVTLSNVTGLANIVDGTGTGTINNDDAAAVTISDVSGAENGGGITVTATLDHGVQGGFTVDVSTADGTATTADSDYTAISNQTLTFTGTSGETQTFTITPVGDNKIEPDETLTISQSNLSGTSFTVDISDDATVTIINDDVVSVTIADVSGMETDGTITVTATLGNAIEGGFSVDVSTANGSATAGSDYTAVINQTLTFAGTTGETQTFTIGLIDDASIEGDETLTISISNLTGTTFPVDISDGATITIVDDEVALGDNLPQGISPNNDGINDAWIIEGIESYPNNKVAIFNRWGQKIYEVSGYDNTSQLFRGVSNQSVVGDKNLPDGSYFYVVDLGDGDVKKGFLVIKN